MKRCSFNKKHKVKFPMPDNKLAKENKPPRRLSGVNKKHKVKFPVVVPGDEIKELEEKAKGLVKRIFEYQPCVMCLLLNDGDHNPNTVPHHILNKGLYDRLRFVFMNLLPLCLFHHRWAHSNMAKFINFLLDKLPKHYRFWKNEVDNKAPVKTTAEDMKLIIDDLEFYDNNPALAEKRIYEK